MGGKTWTQRGKHGKKAIKRFYEATKTNNAWTMAKKAWSGVKHMKEMINSERHIYQLNNTLSPFSSETVNYNGKIFHVSNINQGDGLGQRSGNSILSSGISMRANIKGNFTTLDTQQFRLLYFMDTMNTGTQPTPGDVLQNVGSEIATMSALNQTAAGRYKILKSSLYNLNKNGRMSIAIKDYIKIKKHIKYTSTAGSDEWKNQIYFMVISNVASDDPLFDYVCRFYFYDN